MNDSIKNRISDMPAILMSRNYNFPDYEYDKRHLDMLEDLMNDIQEIFNRGGNEVHELLDGEFKSDNDYRTNLELPLFFHIELMILAIENNMKDTVDLNDRKEDILRRLKVLKDYAINHLKYATMFSPAKHLSEMAKNAISLSKGNFSFGKKRVGNDIFLIYDTTEVYEDIERKNGEYYSKGVTRHNYSNFLYQEDIDYLKEQDMELQRISKPILEDVSECFVNGTVPKFISTMYLPAIVKEEYKDPDFLIVLHNLILKIQKPYTEELLEFSIEELYHMYKLKKSNLKLNGNKVEEDISEDNKESEVKDVVDDFTKKDKKEKKKGFFSRFKGIFGIAEEAANQMDAINDFEDAREKQIKDDNEVRNVIMYERRIENGREVLVPLSNDEYKVVKR